VIDKIRNCSLVLGGHINGYSIVRELSEEIDADIIVFDYGRSLARYSNKVKETHCIERNSQSLLLKIQGLADRYTKVVIFPTDDMQLEWLHELAPQIDSFCYLPFNQTNLLQTLDKFHQYKVCEKEDIPFPKSINLKNTNDISLIESMSFPVLVKPSTRKDLELDVFRTLTLGTIADYKNYRNDLLGFSAAGVEFVASELIPGDDTNIYAYTCFRSNEGQVLNEWVGKKLTQYPDEFGIFSSSSNEAPAMVAELGRKLVKALDCYGIAEPEFKYDHRDKKYKLMEVNLRSMMWHRTGNLSGVKLQKTQFDYAIGQNIKRYQQNQIDRIHYVLMLHEIPNLIARKGYIKHFKYNVFSMNTKAWAVLELNDIKPFLASLILLAKGVIKACQKRFYQK
jgi:D-aspartate ligase